MRSLYFKCDENLNKSLCLEISPLCNPILSPEHPNTRFLDICSTEELKKKYEGDTNVDKDKIVTVHYVDKGGPYSDIVGHERFQLIIASHVIEHIPNVIKWLNGIALILKDDGVERRLTNLADLVGAYIENRKMPTPERVYDFFMFTRPELNSPVVHHDGQQATKHILTKEIHKRAYENAQDSLTKYVDMHCSVWTPETFIEQMNFLTEMNLLNLELIEEETLYTQKNTNEFFVTFKRK